VVLTKDWSFFIAENLPDINGRKKLFPVLNKDGIICVTRMIGIPADIPQYILYIFVIAV
jgi:hypothetical protein